MQQPIPHADSIRAELDKVLASAAFRGSNRSSALLRFVVTAALDGRGQYLKEYTLGTEALGRGDSFDPRVDPIVRVEVSRLRGRLDQYYATESVADEVVISLPKGTYVPLFSIPATRDEKAQESPQRAPAAVPPRRRDALWLAGGMVSAAALGLAYALAPAVPSSSVSSPAPLRLDIALGTPGVIATQVGSSIALSPQGDVLAAVVLTPDGRTRLVTRRLDSLDAIELEGTEGAVGPFFSPDGQWIGFWADRRIKKTLVAGGASPIVLAEAADFLGASWGADGYIVARLDRAERLWRVPENGGVALEVPLTGESGTLRWPQLLPGGRFVLGTTMRGSEPALEAVPLVGGPSRVLLRAGSWGRYLSSGHLVYLDRGRLFAVRFDLERLEVIGAPVRVLDDVAYDPQFGFAQVAFAGNGTMAYVRSSASGFSTIRRLERGDTSRPLLDEPARYQWPRLSPDGRYLAYGLLEGSDPDIWTLDLASRIKTRVTGVGAQSSPVWAPDSRHLVYADMTNPGLYWRRADGTGEAQLLVNGAASAWSFTADGSRLAYHVWNDSTSFDLTALQLEMAADGVRVVHAETLLATPAFENYPALSPDGRWLAYCSNVSGTWEVYVRASSA
ncbi:MAG TPA: hypothetical protein VNP02_05910, partial [Gammaproteobacteria bacterium]|nr:hypothetical protein [Gammaproteobacteria bacterium]